jgi:histone deacetylase 11
MQTFIAYNSDVDFTFPGMAYFHPANLRKYGQAAHLLSTAKIDRLGLRAGQSEVYLKKVHHWEYLAKVLAGDSETFAKAAEVPQLTLAPHWLVRRALANPMIAAVGLTIDSALRAWKQQQVAIALGGGFHHAKPGNGEGFCLLNDVAAAVCAIRDLSNPPRVVAYIDLDAHMGNGVAHCFLDDPAVKLFDLYMKNYYPAADEQAASRLDYGVGLTEADTDEYMFQVEHCLPDWLELISPDFAFVNVGQDVLHNDPLTCFQFTLEDVIRRDRAVAKAIADRNIPVVYVAGGGYTQEAPIVLANTAKTVMDVNQTGAL